MDRPSDHLLKTFAAVPLPCRVLDLACGAGRHAGPLAQLGFDLYACDPAAETVARARTRVAEVMGEEEAARRVTRAHPEALGYPDEHFDWIVAYDAFADSDSRDALLEELTEARRVLKDGGWIYLALPAVPEHADPNRSEAGYAGDSSLAFTFTPETIDEVMEASGFAQAQRAERVQEDGRELLLVIYRRVDEHTPA